MLGSLPRALPCAHSPACSTPHRRQQASVTTLLNFGTRRLHSWQPNLDANSRRHRCGCSSKSSPSETDSDTSCKDKQKDKSEAEPASRNQNEVLSNAEMSELAQKILRGAPGGPARKELPVQYVWQRDFRKLGLALPFTLGIPGTLALVLGYYLHLDPYGHLHWSVPDALTGLAWALPVACVDACLLLPDLRGTRSVMKQSPRNSQSRSDQTSGTPGSTSGSDAVKGKEDAAREHFALMVKLASEHHRKLQSQASTSSEASGAKNNTNGATRPSLNTQRENKQQKEAAQKVMFDKLARRLTQPEGVKGLVRSWQRETVTANPWLQSMPITEVVSIVLRQFPWTMFSRAILQTGLAGWLTDRFYEAGADDVMVLLGDQAIPTSEAAQWTALAVIVGVYTGLALNTPKQSGQFRLPSIPYPPSVKKGVKEKASKDIEKVMKRMQQQTQQRQQAKVAISTVRLIASSIAYGSSYILTGNLLAPYVGSVASKVVFSFWQRVKHEQYSSDFKGHLEDMLRHSTAMLKADKPEI